MSRSSFSDERPKRARLQQRQLHFQLLDMQRLGVNLGVARLQFDLQRGGEGL